MSELDRVIRQALTPEDAKTFERLGADQSLHQQVLETFQGRLRWLNILGSIAGLGLFVVACVFAWRFVSAPDLRSMLLWGAGASLAIAGLAFVKLWFWMELQKNAILREVKRLELQTACLVARLGNES